MLDFFDPNTVWFYRPLVKTYYWVGQSLFGLHPLPFHLFSTLLHLANGFLVYKLVARQPKAGWGLGLAAALIFMLIPYHAETVSWIAATGDLMAAFCILSALILFQLHSEQRKPTYLIISIILFGVGLLARETTIILPLLLVLHMVLLDRSRSKVQATWQTQLAMGARQLVGYFAVTLLYLALQEVGRGGNTLERGGLAFHALSIDSVLLGVMDYALGLIPGGDFLARLPLDALRVIVWMEVVIVLLVVIFLWRNRQSLTLFGLMWLILTPLLFIFFSAPTDRYFYLPSIGYAIFVSSALMVLVPSLIEVRLHMPPYMTKAVVALSMVGLLLSQIASLTAKQNKWREAGQVSAGVFHDIQQAIPEPHDYGAFYIIDIPSSMNGVPFVGNEVQQATQLIYSNQTLTASSITCSHLQAQLEVPKYLYLFRFKGDGVQKLAARDECR